MERELRVGRAARRVGPAPGADSSARAQARAAAQFFGDLPPIPVVVMQGGEDVEITGAQRQALGALMGRWQASMTRLFADARFFEEAIQIFAEITRVLTADQIERLPEGIQRLLNPRFLRFLATQDAATG